MGTIAHRATTHVHHYALPGWMVAFILALGLLALLALGGTYAASEPIGGHGTDLSSLPEYSNEMPTATGSKPLPSAVVP